MPNVAPKVKAKPKHAPRGQGGNDVEDDKSEIDKPQTPGCESKSRSLADLKPTPGYRPPGMPTIGGGSVSQPLQTSGGRKVKALPNPPNQRVRIVINDDEADGHEDDTGSIMGMSREEFDYGYPEDSIRPSATASSSGIFRQDIRNEASTAPPPFTGQGHRLNDAQHEDADVPMPGMPSPKPDRGEGNEDISDDELDQIQCPVCFNINHDPIMLLPCTHIMCHECSKGGSVKRWPG